jgi:hypothetical protein
VGAADEVDGGFGHFFLFLESPFSPFYDGETQSPCFVLYFIRSCLGYVNHPSIRAWKRTVAFGIGS